MKFHVFDVDRLSKRILAVGFRDLKILPYARRQRRDPWKRNIGVLGSILVDPEANDSAKMCFDTAHPEGERPDRERMRGETGRSPSFGDHPSGRQMRKYVWRSRSHVPAALFLSVLGNTWGLLGTFFGVLERSWVPKGRHFGSQSGPKADPKRIQNEDDF